jgi:hypothetical protein
MEWEGHFLMEGMNVREGTSAPQCVPLRLSPLNQQTHQMQLGQRRPCPPTDSDPQPVQNRKRIEGPVL